MRDFPWGPVLVAALLFLLGTSLWPHDERSSEPGYWQEKTWQR